MSRASVWLYLWLFAGPCACQGERTCLALPEDCTPQYTPSFDAVYSNTLSPSCALSGCHGGAQGQGDLAMGENAEDAHAAILPFVIPGDPGCSDLVDHLSPEGAGDMPPGTLLAEEERCAIARWIAQGAER